MSIMRLVLIIKAVYFDEILKGVKTEEYRDWTEHYEARLFDKESGEIRPFTEIEFRDRRDNQARKMICDVSEITYDHYVDDNDVETEEKYFVFKIDNPRLV